MIITPGIKNAFDRRAGSGVILQRIAEVGNETQFTAYVAKLGRAITIGCDGRLTPKQAEAQAGFVAAYLAALAPRKA